MSDEALTRLTARELAAAVRSGSASAEDVARAHLERIAELDRDFGAFQVVDADHVLRDARGVDEDAARRGGPLAGVPVAVKDQFDVAGLPTRRGSAATSERPATADHELVRRLRAAGAFVVGKTSMPELGIWPFTESAAFGVARNPWAPDHTAGGSTGGGAIAVATRMAALSLGADGGGSIRIPAACCGVVGYKPDPTLLRVAHEPEHWLGLTSAGPLARSVDDAALMLDVLAGRPPRPPLGPPGAAPRVAVSTRPLVFGARVTPEVVAATRSAAKQLAAAGCAVVDADPPYPVDLALRFVRRWLAGVSEEAESLDANRLEPRTRGIARAGRVVRRLRLASPIDREPLVRTWSDWFRRHDLLLMPTLAAPPVVHGRWSGGWLSTAVGVGNWIMTPPWNLVGFPAISVPVALSEGHLPIAVQLAAPPGREELILATAHQLAAAMPFPRWEQRA